MVFTKKAVVTIIGLALLPLVAVEAVFINSNFVIAKPTKASEHQTILNSGNVPSISAGEGSLVDDKNVTWEYHNASNKANYHVSLAHKGHFEVSSSSAWGYTSIENLTVTFSCESSSELWLQTSTDGATWSDAAMLESDTATNAANNWRYLRFYHYDTNDGEEHHSVDIQTVKIEYACSDPLNPSSAQEDVDSAKDVNVIATSSNLSHAPEYVDISPNSNGGEAIRFTKSDNQNTNLTLGFGKTYTLGDVQNAKVEFDMKTDNFTKYGKSISLQLDNTTLGSTIWSNKTTSYKWSQIQDTWYHIEVPVTAFISTISGIKVNGEDKDKPHKDVEKKQFNGIKINAGECIIDNFKLTQSPCDLGIYNSPDWKPTVGEFYWLKVSWVGKLYPELVEIEYEGEGTARHIPINYPDLLNGSPFYSELTGAGSMTFKCKVIAGAERIEYNVQFTVTIKSA